MSLLGCLSTNGPRKYTDNKLNFTIHIVILFTSISLFIPLLSWTTKLIYIYRIHKSKKCKIKCNHMLQYFQFYFCSLCIKQNFQSLISYSEHNTSNNFLKLQFGLGQNDQHFKISGVSHKGRPSQNVAYIWMVSVWMMEETRLSGKNYQSK